MCGRKRGGLWLVHVPRELRGEGPSGAEVGGSCHVSSDGRDRPRISQICPPKPSSRQPAVGFCGGAESGRRPAGTAGARRPGCRSGLAAGPVRRAASPAWSGRTRADPAAGRSRRVRRWRRETEGDTGFVSETLPLEQGGSFETVPRREKLHKGEGLVGRRGCGSRENGE